jgi:nucleolar protein 56
MNKKELLNKLYLENLAETKQKVKDSINEDNLIIQTINCIEELTKTVNLNSKRLKEWYGLYNPEKTKEINDNNALARFIVSEKNKEKINDSMGANLKSEDLEEIIALAKHINSTFKLIENYKKYLDTIMTKKCPNLKEIAGYMLGAKLIEHSGSIKKLAMMTASTIQLLGAEKALFRHLKTGSKVPKHGLILQHPLVSNAKQKEKGKIARALADKIAICIRIDYFKGQFIADRLKKELEEKFKN